MHLRSSRGRVVNIVAIFFVTSLSLASCSSGVSPSACATSPGASKDSSGLTAAKGASSTTLPPSHDNDAGDARIPDSTPDADVGANQRHLGCTEPK